jgi:hypothetical protein
MPVEYFLLLWVAAPEQRLHCGSILSDSPMSGHALRAVPAALQALAGLSDALRSDMYLHPHFRYYMREVRVVAYSQVSILSVCVLFLASSKYCRHSTCDT